MNFKKIRITLLLLVLAYFSTDTLLNDQRTSEWKRSIRIVIYPINADGSEAAESYIQQLDSNQFAPLNELLEWQAIRYNKQLNEPFRISLAPPLKSLPPALPPTNRGLSVMWWSTNCVFGHGMKITT